MEQENNNVINLFTKLSQILNTKSSPQKNNTAINVSAPAKISNTTVEFLLSHEKRKNEILNKNKRK